MSMMIVDPPITEEETDEYQERYLIAAESPSKIVCMLWLTADDEEEARKLTCMVFLRRGWGVPTKITVHHVSTDIETLQLATNDDDVAEYLHIDEKEEFGEEMV